MTGQRVGYRRVSSVDQKADRQLDGIQVDKIFTDKASGKDVDRPALQKALDYVREGDTLVVHSMDRLARNLDDLRRIVRDLTDRGVRVEFVKEAQTFTGEDNPMSNLMLSLLGAVAEFERSLIRERQREGIALAKAQGKFRGGQPKLSPEQAAELVRRTRAGESVAGLAREFGVSRQTVYRYASEARGGVRVLWADQHKGADQTVVDPMIRLHPQCDWALPAGWVPVVNDLHERLSSVVPGYCVTQAGQKADRLKFRIDVLDRAAERMIVEAAERTATMCTVCGGPVAEPSNAPRCAAHPRRDVPHAMARPPGQVPT